MIRANSSRLVDVAANEERGNGPAMKRSRYYPRIQRSLKQIHLLAHHVSYLRYINSLASRSSPASASAHPALDLRVRSESIPYAVVIAFQCYTTTTVLPPCVSSTEAPDLASLYSPSPRLEERNSLICITGSCFFIP